MTRGSGRSQLLTTGNYRDWHTVVRQILRRLVLETSVDHQNKFIQDALRWNPGLQTRGIFLALIIWVYLHTLLHVDLRKIATRYTVVQARRNRHQPKPLRDFLLVFHCNCMPVFYRFYCTTIYWSKICAFWSFFRLRLKRKKIGLKFEIYSVKNHASARTPSLSSAACDLLLPSDNHSGSFMPLSRR